MAGSCAALKGHKVAKHRQVCPPETPSTAARLSLPLDRLPAAGGRHLAGGKAGADSLLPLVGELSAGAPADWSSALNRHAGKGQTG